MCERDHLLVYIFDVVASEELCEIFVSLIDLSESIAFVLLFIFSFRLRFIVGLSVCSSNLLNLFLDLSLDASF